MKTTKKKYGLTLCLIVPGLVWLCLQLSFPSYKKSELLGLARDSINRSATINTRETATRLTNYSVEHNAKTENQKPQPWQAVIPTEADQNRDIMVTKQPADGVTESTTEDPILSNKHIVVIVSYMRSGSTLTADILQHSSGTLYVFEPFHSVIVRTRQRQPLHYLNGTVRYLKETDLTDDFLTEELHKWFTCSYDELDVHSLSDNFHGYFSRSMKTLSECLQSKRRTVKSVRECLPSAMEMCNKARRLLFKFIRLPMAIIEDVFELYSNLQVIHLLRDPRGILASQIKLEKSTWKEIGVTSERHCQRVWSDLNSTVYLNEYFPDRVRILLYENLAENPVSIAERLYKFVDVPFQNNIRRYIVQLTLEGRKDSTSYGIIRSNSTRTAYSWRDKINFTDVKTIDRNCEKTYQFLGYQVMASDYAVKNHGIPTFLTPQKDIII